MKFLQLMESRSQLKRYFRHHHHHTDPLKVSHKHFINALAHLEDLSGFDGDISEGPEAWKRILSAINDLNDESVEELFNLIQRSRFDM